MNQGFSKGIVMVIIFAAGAALGYYFGVDSNRPTTTVADEATTEVPAAEPAAATDTPEAATGENVQVDSSMLTDGQQQLLETLGVEPDSITITPAMKTCAEAELGAARLREIQNGATPSFSEGVTLLRCYRSE